jgi:hypothetical protein
VPEEPSIAGVAPTAGRKGKGARESSRRGREISAVGYCRASPAIACARRSTKTSALDCAEYSAALFFSSARNYAASAGGGYSARGVKKQLF